MDQDGNGVGEFGWLGELAGNAPCRGSGTSMNASPFIAAILGVRDARGIAQKSGYLFRVYLPAPGGAIAERNGAAGESARPGAARPQEQRWCAYAWPSSRTQSGNRAFFVNQDGDVYSTPNTTQRYSGTTCVPTPGAALDVSGPDPANLDAGVGLAAAGLTAGDGGTWVPAGN